MRFPLSQTFLSTFTSLISFFTPRNQNIRTSFVRIEDPHRNFFDELQDTALPAAISEAYATTNINVMYTTDKRILCILIAFRKIAKSDH